MTSLFVLIGLLNGVHAVWVTTNGERVWDRSTPFVVWVDFTKLINTWEVYMCDVLGCTDISWPLKDHLTFYMCTQDGGNTCSSWSYAAWNTGTDWGYQHTSADICDKRTRLTLTAPHMVKRRCPFWPTMIRYNITKSCLNVIINLQDPQHCDLGVYPMGIHFTSQTGMLGKIEFKDLAYKLTPPPPIGGNEALQTLVNEVIPIPGLGWQEVFSIETQANPRKNLWIEWVRYNVRVQNISVGCIACAAANTHLYTHALILPDENITECLMELLQGQNSTDCPDYIPLIHRKLKARVPGGVIVLSDNYTCYNSDRAAETSVGVFEASFCTRNSTINTDFLINHTHYMYDIYWLCGDGKLRSRLTNVWRGQCTLVKLAMQFKILPWDPKAPHEPIREVRSIDQLHKGYEEDPQVYIDAIGVPRGVPDQFKAQNQIYAGFASIIPQVQINKNVDWINYIYYSEQRFVNYSRDAFQGIVEELGPNTRMTLQNRLTLDMILAEKGGVCGMIGEECCTYIPQNSGIDGKTLIALQKITKLAGELKANAGVDTSFFSGWLGGLKGFLQQLCMVVLAIIMFGLVILCCVIPLYKKVVAKATSSTTMVAVGMSQLEDTGDMEQYTELDKSDKTPYATLEMRDLV